LVNNLIVAYVKLHVNKKNPGWEQSGGDTLSPYQDPC